MPNPGILAICHKPDISPPSAPTRKSHPTYTHSGLSKGTYQTNKRNHFKEIRDRVCGNIEIENVYNMTFLRLNIQRFQCLEAILYEILSSFSHYKWEGRLLESGLLLE